MQLIESMRNETDSIPDIFLDVLTPASRIHNHNTRFVSELNYFRPRVFTNLVRMSFKFSAPKIWETVPLGLKCLSYNKFEKEWNSYLLINRNLAYMFYHCYYLRCYFLSAAAAYLNMTVSNKKALATLETVHK